jgi:hypothetical protein
MSSHTGAAAPLSAELRRLRLIEWLSRDEPVWRDEDHPELAARGTEAWVRQLREEWSARQSLVDSRNEDEEADAQ